MKRNVKVLIIFPTHFNDEDDWMNLKRFEAKKVLLQ